MHESNVQAYNDRGIELRAQGKLREAVAAFSEGIVAFPNAAVLYNNLAISLDELGAPKEALLAYESALLRAPSWVPALVGKGNLLMRDGKLEQARSFFERALDVQPGSVAANLALYELLQIAGDPQRAIEHQRRALEAQQLYSSRAPNEARSLLVLCAPGDWQANVPVDFLIDRSTTSVHKLYLLDETRMRAARLPRYDAVLCAIAESPEAAAPLRLAQSFLAAQERPALNRPERVLATGRLELARTLAGAGCTVAPVAQVERAALAAGALPFAYPFILRPVGSHAGHDLERIGGAADLAAYLAKTSARSLFASPFVDYRSADGHFRKYRIVYVDGEPFPVHLAVSPNWMIHYYNAPMAEHQWMRDEEAAFLADWESAFAGSLGEAVRGVGREVGLEYFGIDCAIGPDGRLLVFEADPAMLVHTTDPAELYPYKHRYVPRIYRAFEAMVDRRKGADT
ncbi:MAG TPA: tetratricopeptide repeat protein [Verrucomicrobiae bacterium]|nr:tetratricopeptide repeat protein [Verrucomicrobiae bacterium]